MDHQLPPHSEDRLNLLLGSTRVALLGSCYLWLHLFSRPTPTCSLCSINLLPLLFLKYIRPVPDSGNVPMPVLPLNICRANFFTSFRSQYKCHLFSDIFLGYLSENRNSSPPWHSPPSLSCWLFLPLSPPDMISLFHCLIYPLGC